MHSSRYVRAGLIAASMMLATFSLSATADAAAKADAKAVKATAAQLPGDYVGQETCLTCHETQDIKGTAHSRAANERTPAANHQCETCHGAGKAHVDGGGDKTKIANPKTMSMQEASEICVTCHNRKEHGFWSGSQHDNRNVGCTSCHSVHKPKGEKQLKAATQPDLCASCHKNIVNKTNRFNHMPVREGKMGCTSCHNVHGSANEKLLRAGTSVTESCTSCHSEKRGPFLWEHAPVENSCVSCHDPHGSNNDRMLVAKLPYLCQRCHVTSRHPPTIYDSFVLKNSTSANKIYGRSCANCHTNLHGSNAPAGKAFLR